MARTRSKASNSADAATKPGPPRHGKDCFSHLPVEIHHLVATFLKPASTSTDGDDLAHVQTVYALLYTSKYLRSVYHRPAIEAVRDAVLCHYDDARLRQETCAGRARSVVKWVVGRGATTVEMVVEAVRMVDVKAQGYAVEERRKAGR
ncbi:hypothetical protein BJ508DRAFT_365155, partial [Ascobolus immersus RN42]